MKLSLPGVVLLATGAVLMYAAVKNVHPVQALRSIVSGQSPYQGIDPGRRADNEPTASPTIPTVPPYATGPNWTNV